jgi:hypothetical protein
MHLPFLILLMQTFIYFYSSTFPNLNSCVSRFTLPLLSVCLTAILFSFVSVIWFMTRHVNKRELN